MSRVFDPRAVARSLRPNPSPVTLVGEYVDQTGAVEYTVHEDESIIIHKVTVFEPDEEFRTRIIEKYGMWGAFCTEVLESSGKALDECGRHVGLERENKVDGPDTTE